MKSLTNFREFLWGTLDAFAKYQVLIYSLLAVISFGIAVPLTCRYIMNEFDFEWYKALVSAIASSLLITGFVCIVFYLITSLQANESHSINEDLFKSVFLWALIPILYFVYLLIKGSCALLSLIRRRSINHSCKDLNLDDAVQNLNDLRDKGLIDQHDYAEQLHKIVTKYTGRMKC